MMRLLLASLLLSGTTLLSRTVPLFAQDDDLRPTPIVELVEPNVMGQMSLPDQSPAKTNPMLWQQYQAIQAGISPTGCQACGGDGKSPHSRCGCNPELFPWIDGPGANDQWCVGPKWEVQANGLILFRDNTDWDRIIAFVGGTTSLVDQFDSGVGGRIFVTAYNDSGYGLQIGWEGVDRWNATAAFDPIGPETRTFEYSSRFNSVEINFLPHLPYAWKLFSGFRYVELAENFADARINDRPIPPPAAPPAAPVAVIDTTVSRLLKNRLIGFQVGGRRDAWHWGNRLTIESFINAGVYYNNFRRDDVTQIDTTVITGDDIDTPDNEFSQTTTSVRTSVRTTPSDIALLAEAGITSVLKINQVVALRCGYQILTIDGIGQGMDAFFTPGLNNDTLVYHGLQFGVEYRR